MDLFATLRLIFRWWFVAAPMLALSAVMALFLTSSIQPEYTAEGQLLFVAPPAPPDGDTDSNPLLAQPVQLRSVAELAELTLEDRSVADLIAREGLSTDFRVGITGSGLPMLGVQVRAASRDEASATVLRLMQIADQQLELRQDASDVRPENRVSSEVVTVTSVGGADYGGRTRLRLVIFALGSLLALGTVYLLETLREGGYSRRQRADTGGGRPVDQPESEGTDPTSPADVDEPPRDRPSGRTTLRPNDGRATVAGNGNLEPEDAETS